MAMTLGCRRRWSIAKPVAPAVSNCGVLPFYTASPTSRGYAVNGVFIGQIVLASFDFVPAGMVACKGHLLSIAQNQALFALIGTKFGGNGETDFALPDYTRLA